VNGVAHHRPDASRRGYGSRSADAHGVLLDEQAIRAVMLGRDGGSINLMPNMPTRSLQFRRRVVRLESVNGMLKVTYATEAPAAWSSVAAEATSSAAASPSQSRPLPLASTAPHGSVGAGSRLHAPRSSTRRRQDGANSQSCPACT
jgi:hypothetical protein